MGAAVVQTQVGDFEVEVTTEVSHQRSATVTRHPVEGRGHIADHIYVQPASVGISGLVSATPLTGPDDPARLGDAFLALTTLLGQVVTLVTELEVYEDMAVTSLTIPQDPATGDAIRFQMVLEQIRVVSSQTVEIPPEAPPPTKKNAASSNVDRGTQTGTPADAADEEKGSSILADLFGVGT